MARASQPDQPQSGLYVCVESVNFEHGGRNVFVGPGAVFRAGHPIMKGRERFFRPLVLVLSHDALPLHQVSVAVVGTGEDSGDAIPWQWLTVRVPSPDANQSPARNIGE